MGKGTESGLNLRRFKVGLSPFPFPKNQMQRSPKSKAEAKEECEEMGWRVETKNKTDQASNNVCQKSHLNLAHMRFPVQLFKRLKGTEQIRYCKYLNLCVLI